MRAPPVMRAPWFTAHGALGDTAVEAVNLPESVEAAQDMAEKFMNGLPMDRRLTGPVRDRMTRELILVLTPSTEVVLVDDPDRDVNRWTLLLQTGHQHIGSDNRDR